MRHHWILTGRIPNGVLGACVTLAAQKLGFNVKEINLVPIVKVSEFTIRKRINEFFSTYSENLTLKQWIEIKGKNICFTDKIKNSQPPAFQKIEKGEYKDLKKFSFHYAGLTFVKIKGNKPSLLEAIAINMGKQTAIELGILLGEKMKDEHFQHFLIQFFTKRNTVKKTIKRFKKEKLC